MNPVVGFFGKPCILSLVHVIMHVLAGPDGSPYLIEHCLVGLEILQLAISSGPRVDVAGFGRNLASLTSHLRPLKRCAEHCST